jgi:flagellar protein FliL
MNMAATEKEPAEAGSEETTPKKSKKVKILAAVACLAVAAGAAYTLGSKAAPAPAAGAGESTTTTILIQKLGCATPSTDEAPIGTVTLPSMSINLADGHYLRVTLALGMCDDALVPTPEEFLSDASPARDIAVETLSGRTMAELTIEQSRTLVKEDLTAKISAAYPGEVYVVYFVEFVMQ